MTDLLGAAPRVVSVGLDLFAQELSRLGVPVVQLAWSPPAGGDPRLVAMLDRLAERAEAIERANAEALARLVGGEPRLVDCRPGLGGARAAGAHGAALGAADRVGAHVRPMQAAVLCAIRYEDWAAERRRGPPARRGRAHRVWSRVITGRGRPDDGDHHALDAGLRGREPRRAATARTPPSTRASARCCDSAPTTTAWWPAALARHRGRTAAGRRRSAPPAVSISARSWPRRCAWATRCISGTSPPPPC